jgi:uncharacterized protein YpmB
MGNSNKTRKKILEFIGIVVGIILFILICWGAFLFFDNTGNCIYP